MKNTALNKAIQKEFKKEAPSDFTKNLMQKVDASKSTYESLIPKSVFSIVLLVFIIVCTLTILFPPSITLPFALQNLTSLVNEFLSLLIMPLVLLSLLFLKNILYLLKVSKS